MKSKAFENDEARAMMEKSQNTDTAQLEEYVKKVREQNFTIEDLGCLKEAINSTDELKQHYGIIGIRKLLSVHDTPYIQEVIDFGLVSKLIQLTQNDQQFYLQVTTITFFIIMMN